MGIEIARRRTSLSGAGRLTPSPDEATTSARDVFMVKKKTKLDYQIEAKQAAEALLIQAAKLAGIAAAWNEREPMLSVDLQGIEAHLRQIATGLHLPASEAKNAASATVGAGNSTLGTGENDHSGDKTESH